MTMYPPIPTPQGSQEIDTVGRVEMGRLLERIDHLVSALEKSIAKQDTYMERTDERIQSIDKGLALANVEIEHTKQLVIKWNITNFVGTLTAIAHAISAVIVGRFIP